MLINHEPRTGVPLRYWTGEKFNANPVALYGWGDDVRPDKLGEKL